MWDKELSHELAQILKVIADPPDLQPHPQNSWSQVFDGGVIEVMTGLTTFKFSDGARAVYGTGTNFGLSVTLASGEKVSIDIECRLCVMCGRRIRNHVKYCRHCGAASNKPDD